MINGVDPTNPEVYRPPLDLRPAVLRDQTLERCAVSIKGEDEMVTYTVVPTESEVLPEGVDEGWVEPGEHEDSAHRELVLRKQPVVDAGSAFMGDGQRMTKSTEPDRVVKFIERERKAAERQGRAAA